MALHLDKPAHMFKTKARAYVHKLKAIPGLADEGRSSLTTALSEVSGGDGRPAQMLKTIARVS